MNQQELALQIMNNLNIKSLNGKAWTEEEALLYIEACKLMKTTFEYSRDMLSYEHEKFRRGEGEST